MNILTGNRKERLFLAGLVVLGLFVAFVTGSTQDYPAYLEQWQVLLDGHNPWVPEVDGKPVPTNAYGPLHMVPAPLAAIHWVLPKFLFVLLGVGSFALLLGAARTAGHAPPGWRELFRVALLFPLAPLVVVSVVILGNNDIFPAFCMIAACIAYSMGGRASAGVWIGLGALMKFYPLLFVAFLAVGRDGKLDLRAPIVAAAVFAAGMALAYTLWGQQSLSPILFGVERPAKTLSILRLAREFDWLRDTAVLEHLIARNSLYVIAVTICVALYGWLSRWGWELTLLIGILAVFVVYKTGHVQFYLTWLAVWAWILVTRREDPASRAQATRLISQTCPRTTPSP